MNIKFLRNCHFNPSNLSPWKFTTRMSIRDIISIEIKPRDKYNCIDQETFSSPKKIKNVSL